MCLSCPARLQIRNIDFRRRSVAVKPRWETLPGGFFSAAYYCSHTHDASYTLYKRRLGLSFFVMAGPVFCVSCRRAAVNTDGGGGGGENKNLRRFQNPAAAAGQNPTHPSWQHRRAAFPLSLEVLYLPDSMRKDKRKVY